MKRMTLLLLGLFGLVVLTACSNLSESECKGGDWYGIGIQDGTKGRLLTYFEKHVKACSKFGVTPQEVPWREGRERGLRLYCTPENAYQVGRGGRAFSPVCTAEEAADMSLPNSIGLKYYRLGERIDRLKADLDDLPFEAVRTGTETDEEYSRRIAHLRLEKLRLESEIWRLESEQRRYATWP